MPRVTLENIIVENVRCLNVPELAKPAKCLARFLENHCFCHPKSDIAYNEYKILKRLSSRRNPHQEEININR